MDQEQKVCFLLLLISSLSFVSAQSQEACDLDQLANNANPDLLSGCTRNESCTQLTCQTAGVLRNFFGSATFTDMSCLIPPGLRIELMEDNGNVVVNELVTESLVVTGSNHLVGNLTIHALIRSTIDSIEITVDPVIVNTMLFGSVSDYLISATTITADKCKCSGGCCAPETVMSPSRTTYIWPQTFGGETAIFTCPLSPKFTVTRNCLFGGIWEGFDEDGCGVVNGELSALENIFNSLTPSNYKQAVAQLTEIIKLSESSIIEQNSEVVSKVALYVSQLATFVKESSVIISNTVVGDIVQTVNSLTQWEQENVEVDSSSIVIESFEDVTARFALQLSLDEKQKFTALSVTLVAERTGIESLLAEGRSFAIGDSKIEITMADSVMPGESSPQLDAAISLPPSLFELISNRTSSDMVFAHFNESTLFPVEGGNYTNSSAPNQTIVGTDIVAATVVGKTFTDLDDDMSVTIIFQLKIPDGKFKAEGSEMCASWDFTLRDWTPKGCKTNISDDGVITCSCNHLTNFAVLVDICLRQEDCILGASGSIPEVTLTFISYIGMSISIFFLIITIVTLLLFKKLRQKDASKFHMQLCLAMLFMLTVSFVLVVYSAQGFDILYEGCVAVSVLVHYFTLASVMWMGAEALLMFKKLVMIFSEVTTKFIVSVSIICWIVPVFVVAIPLILEMIKIYELVDTGIGNTTDISIRRADIREGLSFCFISHSGVFWGTFLAPILAVMVFNVFIFIWVIIVLIRHKRGRVARKQEKVNAKTILRMMFSVIGVMFLFGLTWLFAILLFTITELREISQLLFTIFNSLQGFFIFLFILNTEALGFWRKLLSCGSKSSKTQSSMAKYKRARRVYNRTGLSSSTTRTSETLLISERGLSTLKVKEVIVESEEVDISFNLEEKNNLSL